MKALVPAIVIAALAAGTAAYAGPAGAGDANRGRTVFARCAACHDASTGANKSGPSLKGIVGRRAASAAGYNFSTGLKTKGGTWTRASLDAYIAGPARYAPGTRMVVSVTDPQQRADLVAYLATLR